MPLLARIGVFLRMRATAIALAWFVGVGVGVAAMLMLGTAPREVALAQPQVRQAMIEPLPTELPAELPAEIKAETPREYAYVGNTNTYKFHARTCRYAGCKNCTAKFATRKEAIDAGYRPCGVCDP